MATSGSRNFIVNRNDIIRAAFRKMGVKDQFSGPTPDETQDAAFALNSMVSSWQNDDIYLWTQLEEILPLVDGTLSYDIDASILEFMLPIFRKNDSDTELYVATRSEYYGIPDKKESGEPISIYVDYLLDNPTVYVWPVPERTSAIVTGTDSNYYLCIQDHTSDADNCPVTGADYATYWRQVTTTPNTVWASGQSYYSDVIIYTKSIRLQDFDAAADNPDFPVRWTQALVYGLAVELAPEFKVPDNLAIRNAQKFQGEYAMARRYLLDATDLVISPGRR